MAMVTAPTMHVCQWNSTYRRLHTTPWRSATPAPATPIPCPGFAFLVVRHPLAVRVFAFGRALRVNPGAQFSSTQTRKPYPVQPPLDIFSRCPVVLVPFVLDLIFGKAKPRFSTDLDGLEDFKSSGCGLPTLTPRISDHSASKLKSNRG